MRVHELAKELGVSSKDLLAKLHDAGIVVKSHMSSVEEAAVELMREEYGASPEETPEAAPLAPEEKAEPAAEAPAAEPEEPKPTTAPEPAETPEAATVDDKVVRVRGAIVVKDLAEHLDVKPNRLVAELMGMNVLASINQRIDINVARRVAQQHGYELVHEKKVTERRPVTKKVDEEEAPDREEDLMPRPPVVTFLGHVDHGKTSLLDKIRDAAVVDDEYGGITQHIGAYMVEVGGRRITFLDTPGHAAFTAMRARGANLTDIAVIVIAADDGIMPQTREAIKHAQAAGVALMVAINKIDLPAANAERVKQQLQAEGLAPEDWGGELICCPVSAQTGDGIDHLLEMIVLQADLLELKANPKRRASGFVVEARLEPGRGPTATLLVTRGTLKLGDALLCGTHSGNVRALISDQGNKLKSASPSTPVKCLGLSGVPEAGAEFKVCANDRASRSLAQEAEANEKEQRFSAPRKTSLDDLFDQIKESEQIELKIILKADTQGSVEAIVHSLEEIQSEKVALNILLSDTGNITVNDVMLASASDAIVLGFHVANESGVNSTAKHEGVEIRTHNVIYELIDEVRTAMEGLLTPIVEERVIGHAEVRQLFSIGRRHIVAGCLVVDGVVRNNSRVRVKRGDEILFEGVMESLKHFQDDVREVREAQECGIRVADFSGYETGDILEFCELERIQQSL